MPSPDSTDSALDAPLSPGLQAMLDLAEMARAKPGTWKSAERGDFVSMVAVLLLGVCAWQSQSIFVAVMAILTLISMVQEANERRAQRQLELILTVLRDLQRRVPVTSDQGV